MGILLTQPMDTIRIRLQDPKLSYGGIGGCAVDTVRAEGIRGLFKGVGSPMLTVGIMNALLFFTYEGTVNALAPGESAPSISTVMTAGAVSGAASADLLGLPTIPMDGATNRGFGRSATTAVYSVVGRDGLRGQSSHLYPAWPRRLLIEILCRRSPPDIPAVMRAVAALLAAATVAGAFVAPSSTADDERSRFGRVFRGVAAVAI